MGAESLLNEIGMITEIHRERIIKLRGALGPVNPGAQGPSFTRLLVETGTDGLIVEAIPIRFGAPERSSPLVSKLLIDRSHWVPSLLPPRYWL